MARKFNKNSISGTKRKKEKKVAENGVGHVDGGPVMSANKLISVPEPLRGALEKIFDEQKVRTIRSVVRDLQELAKRLSVLPKDREKNRHLIDAALCGASETQTSLHHAVIDVAAHVYGVYVMMPPNNDHLRNVFILLFREAKKAKAVLRKQEIMQRGKELFKREINESEYAQVVDEICITTKDGGVMLRSGD